MYLPGGRYQHHPQYERSLQAAETSGGGANFQPGPDPTTVSAHPYAALYRRGKHAARRLPRTLGIPGWL